MRVFRCKERQYAGRARTMIVEVFPELAEHVRVPPTTKQGPDLSLSSTAYQALGASFYCSANHNVTVASVLRQLEDHADDGSDPVAVFRRNQGISYVGMRFSRWLKQKREVHELRKRIPELELKLAQLTATIRWYEAQSGISNLFVGPK